MRPRFFVRCFLPATLLAAGAMLSAKPVSPATIAGVTAQAANGGGTSVEADYGPLGPAQYDTSFTPTPPNVPSLDFAATATTEFGELVQLSGVGHYIDSIVVTMSSWAIRSEYGDPSPYGFTHPITLTLYSVDRTSGTPRASAVLAALRQEFLIPWRPEPDPAASSSLRPWRADNGNYYTGRAFNLTFDLGAVGIALPDEVIFGISFDTQHHGRMPLGAPGPYDMLHLGLTERAPRPGIDADPGAVFWETADRAAYAQPVAENDARLRRDSGWAAYKPAVRFTNSAFGTVVDVAAVLAQLRSPNPAHEAALRSATTLLSQAQLRGLWDGTNRLDAEYGRLVFGLLAEVVATLGPTAQSKDVSAAVARTSVDALLNAAASLAETALGDAIIAGGNGRKISRSQGALDAAHASEARSRFDRAIDRFGAAWREAHGALWE